MAITDGTDQSKVAPPPNERSTKNRLLLDCYDSDGSDSGVDTNGRQHDEADLGPVSSHEGDIIVDKGQPCEDPASPEAESTRENETLAPQPSRKRKMPSSGQSDSDSTTDSDIRTQRETADGHDHTILAGSACRNNDPGLLLARLPEDLQCIREYRISASDKAGKPYFELECLMQDGQWYWIAESDVQRSVPSAVGTFWGCGPEDWIAPKPGEKETGRAYWKRPLATDDDGVPDALLISGRKTTKYGQTQFPMQKVGYPTTPPTWHDEDTVKDEWTQEYERYQLHHANYRDLMNGEEPRFVAVVGHRLNGENGSQKGIQFSCQWTNGTESWEPEDDVQRKYNAAALTYWQSDAKARRACKVPDRRLRIVGHDKSGTKLLLKVQMVGRSCYDMCAICGKLPCQRSSTCRPNIPLEPVGRLLLKWREATEQYLEDQDLCCYNTKPTLKRRSKRLR